MSYSRISQFFILSPRGDSILSRDFRGDVTRASAEKFFRKIKTDQDTAPIFLLDGITFMHLKSNGLWFVSTTKANVCPSLQIELLHRLTRVFKDYCGVLTEESIRKNFILLYELLDEILDYGYPQGTSTEILKAYVFNEPNVSKSKNVVKNLKKKMKIPDMNPKTTPSTEVDKPIDFGRDIKKKQRNEIFVDIFERISVTFNSNGYALSSSVDGTIQMKSYLSGNPELKLALNEDLIVGAKNKRNNNYGSVILDDCNFHGCVQKDDWETSRTLTFLPPDGEFAVLNYRVTNEFRQPFRIFPYFDLTSPYKVELIIKIRADIPEQNYGGNVLVELPIPKSAQSATSELGMGVVGQSSEFDTKHRKIVWRIKKFPGGTEQAVRVKISFKEQQSNNVRKSIGPISMQFEIPMYNVSNLQVRYLRIMETHKKYNPYRWVRYVTRSQSYICRL